MICLYIVNLRYIFLFLTMIIYIWTSKTLTSRCDISNKVTVINVMVKLHWMTQEKNIYVKHVNFIIK